MVALATSVKMCIIKGKIGGKRDDHQRLSEKTTADDFSQLF